MGSTPVFVFGAFCLDPAKRLLLRDGARVAITPKTFDTLCILIENRDHVVAKEELTRRLWPDTVVEEGNLKVQVAAVRRTLRDGEKGNRYIATVPGRGYWFVAPVVRSTGTASPILPFVKW